MVLYALDTVMEEIAVDGKVDTVGLHCIFGVAVSAQNAIE